MTSRSKRNPKLVDYAAVDNPFSDDDFSDFTPPTKKKKEKVKHKEKNKENEDVAKYNEDNGAVKTQMASKSRSHKERISVEERKFQRELEQALELSSKETDASQNFQGFNNNENNEEAISMNTSSEAATTSPFSPLFSPEKVITTVDVHSTFSGSKTKSGNLKGGTEEALEPMLEQKEQHLTTSSSQLPNKRQRNKVHFFEDDSDDEWNSDIDGIRTLSDETEESDFCPSPELKKKNKKAPQKEKAKAPSRSQLSKKAKADKVTSKKAVGKPILKIKDVSVDLSASVVNNDPSISKKTYTTPSNASSASDVRPLVAKPTKVSSAPSTPNSSGISRVGLVKTSFKSPTIGSSSSPSLQNVSKLSTTGLRLGLSRRAHVKPLHPNASVK